MSNALSAATQPAAQADELLSKPMLMLLAVGICVLVPWACFRLARPGKLALRRVPGRANHVHILHVLVVFLIYLASLSLAGKALAAALEIELAKGAEAPMIVSLPAGMFAQVLWIAASIALAATTFRHGLRRGLGLSGRRWAWDAARAAVGYFALLPIIILVFVPTRLLLEAIRPKWLIEHPMLVGLSAATLPWKVAIIFSTVVLAPVAEEVFYRGLVQSMLKRYLGGRAWPAVLATSAIFAASHFSQPVAVPALFVLSVGIGYNYERTGRLVSPILIHAIFNALQIWAKLAG